MPIYVKKSNEFHDIEWLYFRCCDVPLKYISRNCCKWEELLQKVLKPLRICLHIFWYVIQKKGDIFSTHPLPTKMIVEKANFFRRKSNWTQAWKIFVKIYLILQVVSAFFSLPLSWCWLQHKRRLCKGFGLQNGLWPTPMCGEYCPEMVGHNTKEDCVNSFDCQMASGQPQCVVSTVLRWLYIIPRRIVWIVLTVRWLLANPNVW